MDPQFNTNMTTWYVIIPILVVGLALLIWFIVKMKTSVRKRILLLVVSAFAFFGFTISVLTVYYHLNDPFAAMFRFYAYSKLAPDKDPFTNTDIPDKSVIRMLFVTEGYREDGHVHISNLSPYFDYDYAGYLFTPGKWQWIQMDNDILTIQDSDKNGQPDIIDTSLWWALSKDPFRMKFNVSEDS